MIFRAWSYIHGKKPKGYYQEAYLCVNALYDRIAITQLKLEQKGLGEALALIYRKEEDDLYTLLHKLLSTAKIERSPELIDTEIQHRKAHIKCLGQFGNE